MNSSASMTIGELARAGGVGVETIRYYQRLRLLDRPPRAYGTVRRYDGATLERVQFIKRAQRLGFSLAEIKVLYLLDPRRGRHRAHALAKTKLAEIDQKVSDLVAMRSALTALVGACESGDNDLPCPIVVAFSGTVSDPLAT